MNNIFGYMFQKAASDCHQNGSALIKDGHMTKEYIQAYIKVAKDLMGNQAKQDKRVLSK